VNKGVQKLAVHLSAPTDVTLAVCFAPTYGFEPAPGPVPGAGPETG